MTRRWRRRGAGSGTSSGLPKEGVSSCRWCRLPSRVSSKLRPGSSATSGAPEAGHAGGGRVPAAPVVPDSRPQRRSADPPTRWCRAVVRKVLRNVQRSDKAKTLPANQPHSQNARKAATKKRPGPRPEAKGWGCRLQLHRLSHHHSMDPCWPRGAEPVSIRGIKKPLRRRSGGWSPIRPALWRLQPMNSRLGAETPAEEVPFR